ncbi:MAG: hypothetical protein H6Q86_3218, partial [candidate division NC10 bacterium]|nr:hypothetical protein [candidate division NC10 bacterium]
GDENHDEDGTGRVLRGGGESRECACEERLAPGGDGGRPLLPEDGAQAPGGEESAGHECGRDRIRDDDAPSLHQRRCRGEKQSRDEGRRVAGEPARAGGISPASGRP